MCGVWVLEINVSGFYLASCQHSIVADVDVKAQGFYRFCWQSELMKANGGISRDIVLPSTAVTVAS